MNYFYEAERVLIERQNLHKKLEKMANIRAFILENGLPNDIKGGNKEDAERYCVSLIDKQIAEVQESARLTDHVIGQLPDEKKRLLALWYIEGQTKDQIHDAMLKDGSNTIYSMKKKAIGEFAVLYFGSSALQSV